MVTATQEGEALTVCGWLLFKTERPTSWAEAVAGATSDATWREWSDQIALAERLLVGIQDGSLMPTNGDLLGLMSAMSFDAATCRISTDMPEWSNHIDDRLRREPWDCCLVTILGVPKAGDRLGEPISRTHLLHLRRDRDTMPRMLRLLISQVLIEHPWQEGYLHHLTLLPIGRQPAVHLRCLEIPPQ